MSDNIKYNQLNGIIDNELVIDSSNSLANNPIKDTLPIVITGLRFGKRSKHTLNSGLTCLWDSGATNIMIKHKHINPYESKLTANKVKYSTDDGLYKTTYDMKVPFSMPCFFSRKL